MALLAAVRHADAGVGPGGASDAIGGTRKAPFKIRPDPSIGIAHGASYSLAQASAQPALVLGGHKESTCTKRRAPCWSRGFLERLQANLKTRATMAHLQGRRID